ncbi:MAG: aldose 1-epimerase family protein [Candidatus Dormibacteraceae bacterium]
MGLPSGRQIELRRGDQRAVVVEAGGGLCEYVAGGRQVLDGFAPGEMAIGGRGQPLLPWPNRLEDGRYHFGGRDLQAPIDEPATGCAIHGLTRWLNWTPIEQADDRATMALILHPQPGYPFSLDLEIRYALGDEGLTVETQAVNLGDADLPFGAGQHPYLAAGAGLVDDLTLRLPGSLRLEMDERGLPTGRRLDVGGTDYDFRFPRLVGGLVLDTCFTGLDRDGAGRASVEVRRADATGATLWVDTAYPYLMVFSGDTLAPARRRRGLAVEPMTCPPNAFRTGEGLRVLAPGDRLTVAWGIRPS